MKNVQIAIFFRNIAKLLALKADNPFRIRAYERAALNIENLSEDLSILKHKQLLHIPGVGKDISSKIEEIINTGSLKFYEELTKKVPKSLLPMLNIPGLGPRTVQSIYEKLKIDNIDELKSAAKDGKLQIIEGINAQTEKNILKGIEFVKNGIKCVPLYFALSTARIFLEALKSLDVIERVEIAGSLRRRKDTVKDIDILASSNKPGIVMDTFVNVEEVKEVLLKGETKSSVLTSEPNIQVDLRVVRRKSFGSALMYFTGSKQFNIKLRQLSQKSGYRINEYGVFLNKGTGRNKQIVGSSEEDIFSFMKMQVIPPQLREDRGEVEAALKHSLPSLIGLEDIKGDLHIHSCYSDGLGSIEDITRAAQNLGYEYIAITDHSRSLKLAHGLDKTAIYKKLKELEEVNKKYSKIKIFCGSEVDILSDGALDYPDSILKKFDLVIASIHSGFKQSRGKLTKRIIAACKNKYVHIIGHLSGRLLGVRDGYDIDLDEIFKAAGDYNKVLEINCSPRRMDLNDVNVLQAAHYGVKLSLGTDAHLIPQLSMMNLGVNVAQRGWLQKRDVLNCLSLKELVKWLKR